MGVPTYFGLAEVILMLDARCCGDMASLDSLFSSLNGVLPLLKACICGGSTFICGGNFRLALPVLSCSLGDACLLIDMWFSMTFYDSSWSLFDLYPDMLCPKSPWVCTRTRRFGQNFWALISAGVLRKLYFFLLPELYGGIVN